MLDSVKIRIISELLRNGPQSQKDLMIATGASKGRVSLIVSEMLYRNELVQCGVVRGKGRPSVIVALGEELGIFAGITLHCDPGIVAIVDLRGNIIARKTFARVDDPERCLRNAVKSLESLAQKVGIPLKRLDGIGVSLPGHVSRNRSVCMRSTVLGWEQTEIKSFLEQKLGSSVIIDNDTNALAVYEQMFGQMRNNKSFGIVSVGDGIGSAIILDGTLWRGQHGAAGEIAHVAAAARADVRDAIPCPCGGRGCLETISSLRAIRSRGILLGLFSELSMLSHLAKTGNTQALAILSDAAEALGASISTYIQILDPEHILIVVEEDIFIKFFESCIRRAVEKRVMPSTFHSTKITIKKSVLSDWAIGAASIAARELFIPSLIRRGLDA